MVPREDSPWSNPPPDEYDPQLHGCDEQPSHAPQRWLGLLIVLAIVCAVVALMGGAGTLPAFRP